MVVIGCALVTGCSAQAGYSARASEAAEVFNAGDYLVCRDGDKVARFKGPVTGPATQVELSGFTDRDIRAVSSLPCTAGVARYGDGSTRGYDECTRPAAGVLVSNRALDANGNETVTRVYTFTGAGDGAPELKETLSTCTFAPMGPIPDVVR
jgi:hypothetical protein